MNESFRSRPMTKLMTLLGVLLVALLIFWAGTAVGYREGHFADEWNTNYTRQFGGPGSPFVPESAQDDSFMSAHGAFGQIVGVRLPDVVVKGPEESEKTVILDAGTVIRHFHDAATTTDLIPGETVVVIGEPDSQGDIHASLIRIVPDAPPAGTPGMGTSSGAMTTTH